MKTPHTAIAAALTRLAGLASFASFATAACLACTACLACFACFATGVCAQPAAAQPFRLPDIPATLTTPDERAAYLSLHYWDHFDFADTTLISRPEITEQAFVDFISILPYSPKAQAAVDTLVNRTLASEPMFYHFVSLTDKYLYEPNSPMHNEELHILVLRAQVGNPRIAEIDKLRPRHLLEIALKNRPGDIAADFAFTCRDGSRKRLSGIDADYLLIYFNDPDCEECRHMKEQLAASAAVNALIESGHLALLSVCVEGKTAAWDRATLPDRWIDGCDAGQQLTRDLVYDLKAIPSLYLLDRNKRVLLKDAPLPLIEQHLTAAGQ